MTKLMQGRRAPIDQRGTNSLGEHHKGGPRATHHRAYTGNPMGDVEAVLPILTEIEVMEMALTMASLILLIVVKEEGMLVAKLPVLVLLVEPIIVEVIEEEETIAECLLVIENMVEALSATAELLTCKVVGEIMGKAA